MARYVTILGRTWRLIHPNRIGKENHRGLCDSPNRKHPKIRVKKCLRGEERLEIYLHEMLHAAGWHIDEDFVTNFAADVARELWQLGYRRMEEEGNG